MSFQILDNLEVPASAKRSRGEGPLKATVRNLQVGQGFMYKSTSPLKAQYAKIAVKGEDGKKLFKTKLWLAEAATYEGGENTYGVKRVA